MKRLRVQGSDPDAPLVKRTRSDNDDNKDLPVDWWTPSKRVEHKGGLWLDPLKGSRPDSEVRIVHFVGSSAIYLNVMPYQNVICASISTDAIHAFSRMAARGAPGVPFRSLFLRQIIVLETSMPWAFLTPELIRTMPNLRYVNITCGIGHARRQALSDYIARLCFSEIYRRTFQYDIPHSRMSIHAIPDWQPFKATLSIALPHVPADLFRIVHAFIGGGPHVIL